MNNVHQNSVKKFYIKKLIKRNFKSVEGSERRRYVYDKRYFKGRLASNTTLNNFSNFQKKKKTKLILQHLYSTGVVNLIRGVTIKSDNLTDTKIKLDKKRKGLSFWNDFYNFCFEIFRESIEWIIYLLNLKIPRSHLGELRYSINIHVTFRSTQKLAVWKTNTPKKE